MFEREKFIALLDTDLCSEGDVIVLLEGDGFSRYNRAVELYKRRYGKKIIFSGDFDDEKSGAFTFDKIKPLLIEKGVDESDLLFENKSQNTYEQAEQIVSMSLEYNWDKIIIVASHYHSYRAFLTFLKVQKKINPTLIIEMSPVSDLDWYEETGYGVRVELLELELNKIEVYQKKDNVASYEEGLVYLKWKFQQRKK